MSKSKSLDKSIRDNRIKGYALSILTFPFIPIVLLKLIYNVPGDSGISKGIRDYISKTFQWDYVKIMWPITPNASTATLFTIGNFMALLIFGVFIFGGYLIGKAKRDKTRLIQAKREAEQLDLIEELRYSRKH